MGRERQKRKNRSSLSKVKQKQPTKSGRKKINFLGNAILAANWDKSQTLTQNYRRLGLTSKLNAPTGGVEVTDPELKATEAVEPLHISNSGHGYGKPVEILRPGEVQVERDPETGRILRIIRPAEDEDAEEKSRKRKNPLKDPLNELSDSENDAAVSSRSRSKASRKSKGIVPIFENLADEEAARPRKQRHQSRREEEWVARLVEKHGDDYGAMSRDRRLNVMQQSEGDLRKRVRRWREEAKGA